MLNGAFANHYTLERMEPIADVAQELRALEEYLLRSDVRANPDLLQAVLDDDFVEFGSSGRIFDKRSITHALAQEAPWQYTLSEFHATTLSEEVVLVTYRLNIAEIKTLRSSLWKRVNGTWKIVFHQGTRTNAF